MQYSPKLKKAIEQIKKILNENDIAGFVALHTPGYSEFLNHVTTSYSCATVMPEGIRLRLNEKEIGKEKAKYLADGTVNMVVHLTKALCTNTQMYMTCEDKLKEVWDIDISDDLGYTSHNEQNS